MEPLVGNPHPHVGVGVGRLTYNVSTDEWSDPGGVHGVDPYSPYTCVVQHIAVD